MTITTISTATDKAAAKPTSEKTGQGRFNKVLFVAGMIFVTLYRHNPDVHHAVQPCLHALSPFLF